MCVIVIKPQEIKIKEEWIEMCWEANPHGAGFAIVGKTSVYWQKGIMELKELQEELSKHINEEMVIHFRLMSAGLLTPTQTHPFLLSNEKMGLTGKTHKILLFHNGHISGWGNEKESDTQQFVKAIRKIDPKDLPKLLIAVGGKWTIVSPGKILTVGNFVEKEGCLFSNLYWDTQYLNTLYWNIKPKKQNSFNTKWDWQW